MDIKKEGSVPEVKELHSGCSWIPTTPAKPVLLSPEPIYADSQENQLGQANWSESERFFQGNQLDQVNCLEPERYKPGFSLESTYCDSTSYVIDLNKDFEMPFADLFALADAATATTATANKTQCVNNSPEGGRFQSGSANSLLSGQHASPGLNLCSTSDRALGIPQYEGSIPCRLTYDLNSPPRTITNTGSSMITTPLFAPVTPHQAKSAENKPGSDIQNTSMHKRTQAKANKSEVVTTRAEVSKQHHEKEQSQLLKELSCPALSTPVEENHNPDKGVNHGIDLNKTPQQKPRRKKHRPKVVIEGKPKKTRKPTKPAGENPTGKRKYALRNEFNKPTSTPSARVTRRTINPNTVGNRRNSCKRSLNFDFERQVRDKHSLPMHFSNFNSESQAQNFFTRVPSKSTVQLGQGIEVTVENTEMGIAYDLTRSMNEVLKDYISMPERQSPSTPSPTKTYQPHEKLKDETTNECSRGKCLTVVTNETDDKQDNIRGVTYTESQSAPRGKKRAHSCVIDETQLTTVTVKGPYYNALQPYFMFPVKQNDNQFLGIHFPASCKKKRTGKARNSAMSSTLSTVTAAENCEKRATMCPLNNTSSIHNKQQTFACMLALSHAKRLTKKRWKGTTRVRDLSSLIQIMKCKQQPTFPARRAPTSGNRQGFEVSHQPHTCMEALLAQTHMKMATKKRSRRNYIVNSLPPSTFGHHQSFGKTKGPLPVAIWKNMSPIAAIVEQLKQLDINGTSKKVERQEQQNALVPYNLRYREQNTLVLYRRDGTVVQLEGSFDPVKKRRPRAKVDLDEETNRVWELLLENINGEGIDGTDEEKAKCWEEERNVFRGRADSFIARMHLVLGDRRFTKWKGSVVDSVIGVFLTQNVSDHLSSSAFMSLAARFPLKSKSNPRPSSQVKWDEEELSHPLCDQNSGTLHDMACNEEREVLISNETFGRDIGGVRSTNNSECELFGYYESIETHHEAAENRSTTQMTETDASFTGDEREIDSVLSSQNSVNSSIVPSTDDSRGNSEDLTGGSTTKMFGSSTSFTKLLQINGTTMIPRVYSHVSEEVSPYEKDEHNQAKSKGCDSQEEKESNPSSNNIYLNPNSGANDVGYIDMLKEESTSSDFTKENEENLTGEQSELMAESISQPTVQETVTESFQCAPTTSSQNEHACNNIESQTHEHSQRQKVKEVPNFSEEILDITESTSITENPRNIRHKTDPNFNAYGCIPRKTDNGISASTSKEKSGRMGKEKQNTVDWDSLRKQAQVNGKNRERTRNTMDSVDWEEVRCANVNEIANTIRERGMNHMLAERIKDFLNRLVREHGSIDLEWLRDVPPDKAKEYLLSVRGLGLKSVECVRLLTLHHLAFPVDTNVGRIAVRLGWVPLQPLPESLQLHLLELYPMLESIQKYLWPRLCKLDQRTLYELHYQMITFGKVFCTKSKPNCNACPMRGECRHFASAFASARLALPGPEEKSIVSAAETKAANPNPMGIITQVHLNLPQPNQQLEEQSEIKNSEPIIEVPASPKPIIEEPATPEPEHTQILDSDIEDTFCEDPEEIPTIKLNIKEFTQNLQNYMQQNMELEEGDMSKALVALTPEAASIPMPKLKNVSRLRTEHQVYELPDSHPLLEALDNREPDDPSSYLLAIWTPGETANSIHQPERRCNFQEIGELCDENTCLSCNSVREENSQTVRGTLLIPCRTAMRGSFPLNGTYFQVNEVFADHESSINPIDVPRAWIWNLPRRTVYFGTSIPTIFKGLPTEGIQYCFWRGFVCVRGFDQKTRAPRPLMARLHFPASKLIRTKGRTDDK